MRDTVMNEKYFREYILEETGRIKNFQNKLENNETINTVAGEGIGYIVPQNVDRNSNEDINLFMRVRNIYKNKKNVII